MIQAKVDKELGNKSKMQSGEDIILVNIIIIIIIIIIINLF